MRNAILSKDGIPESTRFNALSLRNTHLKSLTLIKECPKSIETVGQCLKAFKVNISTFS